MSDSDTRAELFASLRTLAGVVPEMRGGQLMAAVGELCADLHGRGLWDASDAELLEAVWQFRNDFERHLHAFQLEALSAMCSDSFRAKVRAMLASSSHASRPRASSPSSAWVPSFRPSCARAPCILCSPTPPR